MDQLIYQFAQKTPVHLLDKHRRLMQKSGHLSTVLIKSVFGTQSVFGVSENQPCNDCIMTGSMAEGASFARLFNPDSNTSSESETDLMFPIIEWPVDEGLAYIDKNKAFVHIVVGWKVKRQFTSTFGEDAAQKMFSQKEGEIYFSPTLLKIWFKDIILQTPNVNNSFGIRPCIIDRTGDVGSAALTIHVDEIIDEKAAGPSEPSDSDSTSSTIAFESRKAQINASIDDMYFKLIKEIIPCCEKFGIRITEMLAYLQRVQEEFLVMRSEELSVPIYNQALKALEWAMTCVDITDDIFDTRKATFGRFLNAAFNFCISEEHYREYTKQTLKNYIDQLAVSEDDVSDASVAAAVRQLLSEMERTYIAPERFVVAFREFARQQANYSKMLTYIDRNPQLSEIPGPLQQLSAGLKRISYDFVPCLKLMFWPRVAAEWKTRDRVWPDQSAIDEIVSKGVHKAFCHDDIDWRLSFSVAEIDLAIRWSPAQHFVYFIFKSLFYKFLKPLSSDTTADVSPSKSSKTYLASYTAKTVMMWTSESVDQSWWTEGNAAECLTVLLLALQSAFECRTLDHYFVSSVNLLEDLPDVLASRVIDTINSILADPAAIVDQLESHFEGTEVMFNAMPEQAKGVEMMSSLLNLTRYSCGSQSSPIQILFM